MRAKIRTNIQTTPGYPIHNVSIIKNSGSSLGPIDYVIHGGQYGANWKQDNHPTHPYYWELNWCYDQRVDPNDQPVTICLDVEIVGAAAGITGSGSSSSLINCVNISNCNPINCGYKLCWSDYNALFNEVIGFVLDCGNGPEEYTWNPGISTSGGFDDIKTAILTKAANNIPNWSFTSPSLVGGDCYKGSSPLPSLFFANSNCKVISLIGNKNGSKFYIPFNEDCLY